MRLFLLALGFVLGVGATLVFAIFIRPTGTPVVRSLPAEPSITVVLGEHFLGEMIRQAVRESPGMATAPTDIRVRLRSDTIVVHASVEVLGRRTEGTAVLRPVLKQGRLRVDVVQTSLGAMPIPPLEQSLEAQINARIGSLLTGMPVTFTGVRVEPTRGLVLTCNVEVESLGARALGATSRFFTRELRASPASAESSR